jgi:hypothetical protein
MNKPSKNQKGFAVFEVLFFLLLAIVLAGAAYYVGNHNNNTKSSSASVAPNSNANKESSDNNDVTKQTQSAYTAFLKVASEKGSTEFIQSSGYFTSDFKSLPGGDYDKLLCDQDIIPKSVNVTDPKINGASASVNVTKVASDYSYPSFRVNLTKTNDKWLISSTDCTAYIAQITKQQ